MSRKQEPQAQQRQRPNEQSVEEIQSSLIVSDYLLELYSEANDSWEEFRSSQRPADLIDTAKILCDGLGGLQADSTFWRAAQELAIVAASGEHREDVDNRLRFDIDNLLAVEEDVLTKRFGRQKARHLVSDFAIAWDLVHRRPDAGAIENLRNRMSSLLDATCETAQPSSILGPPDAHRSARPWYDRYYRRVRVVGRGVLFMGGGALVVANSIMPEDIPTALSSVMSGLGMMFQQVEQQEKELPESDAT